MTKGAKPSVIKAADALIISPEFIQLTKQPTAANAKRFAGSEQFSKFVRAAGNPREMSNRERWVLQAVQAKNNQNQ